MDSVFVDSSAWIAVVRSRDRRHEDAASHLEALVERGLPLATSSYVLSESATRLRYDEGLRTALLFRELTDKAVGDGLLRIVWVDREYHERGWEVLSQHESLKLSLCDGVTCAICEKLGIDEVFAFDEDMRALGLQLGPS